MFWRKKKQAPQDMGVDTRELKLMATQIQAASGFEPYMILRGAWFGGDDTKHPNKFLGHVMWLLSYNASTNERRVDSFGKDIEGHGLNNYVKLWLAGGNKAFEMLDPTKVDFKIIYENENAMAGIPATDADKGAMADAIYSLDGAGSEWRS